MSILSLFDGMSCGQIALRELGVAYGKYYASEIDRHAIRQAQLNFPNTVQLGDVTAWRSWDIPWGEVDLILAGSPCQGFSCTGKMEAFADPRSRLFFEFVDILNHARQANPCVRFVLENVAMPKRWLRVISGAVGVHPVRINSALVSGQNRDRYYWTDIRTRRDGLFGELHADIPQPADRGIALADILDDDVDEKYTLRGKLLERIRREAPELAREKAYCVSTRNSTTSGGRRRAITVVSAALRSRGRGQHVESSYSGKANALDATIKDSLVMQLNPSRESKGSCPYQHARVYDVRGKAPAQVASRGVRSCNVIGDGGLRRLTPAECARLQTIPAWYRWACSETQQYRMLGNGWTIEVVKHILSFF